jgi:8-oxo-dGTP pyrophosphatase MutT (NUDIX family)
MTKIRQEFKLAVHAWFQKDNKFLVVRRSLNDDFMPGFWDTPGGSLDFGEDPLKALTRETKEESGLDIKIGQLLYCHNEVYKNTRHWFALVYRCEIIGDQQITLDPSEHSEYRWVTLEELKDLPKIDFLKDFFQNYLQKNL